jgi:hypothetical protein
MAQKVPKTSFELLELTALPPGTGARDSEYTPGILGESEPLYGSAGRTRLRMERGTAPITRS